jgi:hypothetical protein
MIDGFMVRFPADRAGAQSGAAAKEKAEPPKGRFSQLCEG